MTRAVAIALVLGCACTGPPIEVQRRSGEVCAAWDVPAHPAPVPGDLPAVPEVLWRWDPWEDPVVLAHPLVRGPPQMTEITIGPAGDIWLIGPTDGEVTHVSRDGHALAMHHAFDAAAHQTRFSDLRIAPNGWLFAGSSGADAALRVYSPTGHELSWDNGTELSPGALFGPEGVAYVVGAEGWDTVLASCGGHPDRVSYALRTSTHRLQLIDGSGAPNFIDAHAASLVAVVDGEIVERASAGLPRGDDVETSLFGVANGAVLLSWYRAGALRYTRSLILPDGTVLNRDLPTDVVSGEHERLDPLGGLWQQLGRQLRRSVADEEVWRLESAPCITRSGLFGDDGSLICVRYDFARGRPVPHVIRVDARTGDVLWEVDLEPLGALGFRELAGPDLDGRIYLAVVLAGDRYELWALQTDVLPPSGEFCGPGSQCNRHGSGSTLDYRPR